ncbi:MAG: hypothetical protein FWH53_00115 [Leptospirales bacterium]|nr:hypothetical protein [Leptospirales bacterium]
MIVHQIKYFKKLIEKMITSRDGASNPLNKSFFEVYPKSATIKQVLPCACLRQQSGSTSFYGGFDRIEQNNNMIHRIRKIYEAETSWQIDFFSKDIYDFIEADESYTGFMNQFVKLVTEHYRIVDPRGNAIEFEPGSFGIIDDESIIVDGIYMAYCQVKAIDGIYSSESFPELPGGENNYIISEGING